MSKWNFCAHCGGKFVTAHQMVTFYEADCLISRVNCAGCAGFSIPPIPANELNIDASKWINR